MLRHLATSMLRKPVADWPGLLFMESTATQLHAAAAISMTWAAPMSVCGIQRSFITALGQHHSRQCQQHGSGSCKNKQQDPSSAAAAAVDRQEAAARSFAAPLAPWHQPLYQQWQQQRGLLGVVKHKNYQDHNQKKPPKCKIKTPSIVKQRVLVGEDGTMWRMQAGRRHKRYKKGRRRLLALKGMVPLHRAHAAKLRKLGYKRSWWYTLKA